MKFQKYIFRGNAEHLSKQITFENVVRCLISPRCLFNLNVAELWTK